MFNTDYCSSTGYYHQLLHRKYKIKGKESSAKFLDDLERLPKLSKEELTALSERVKNFNKKKK